MLSNVATLNEDYRASIMTIVTEERGRLNAYAIEPTMYIDPTIETKLMKEEYVTHNEKAERWNGRLAMLGIIAALGAYAVTGDIIPGLF